MRRTRHVVLPVRSWRYIGLLIVSLACLTLGLVSRDREGHAGNLIGPEFEHQAPHETDACPNLNSSIKLETRSIIQSEEITKPANDYEMRVFRMMPSSRISISSQSLNHDRLSGIGLPNIRRGSSKIDRRTVERSWSRTFDTDSLDKSWKSQSRRISQFRDNGNSYDSARFIRSRNSIVSRSRNNERRSLDSGERRLIDYRNNQMRNSAVVFIERRVIDETTPRVSKNNRVDRSMIRRNSLYHQQRANDYRVNRRSMERHVTNRNDRINRRSEVLERHKSDRSLQRSSDREETTTKSQLNRIAGQTRRNIDLGNRLLENRRIFLTRIANQPDNSRLSIKDPSRNSVRSNERALLSRSRTEYLDSIDDLPTRERFNRRSMEFNIEDSDNHGSSYERRGSLVRSSILRRHIVEQTAERRDENRLRHQRFIDRTSSRTSNRENIHQSRGGVSTSKRDWHRDVTIGENRFRTTPTRQSRYDLNRALSMPKRGERFTSRSPQRNALARLRVSRNSDSTANYEINRSRDYSHEQRDLSIDRREGTHRQRYREERRTVSRDIERRRVDIREQIIEKRDSARHDLSLKQRVNENAKFDKRSVIENHRLGRNSMLRDSISIRITEGKGKSREFILRNKDRRLPEAGLEKLRNLQTKNYLKERRVTRLIENRLTEYPEVESIRPRQQPSSWDFNDPSRSVSSIRRIARISHALEQNARKQRQSPTEKTLSRTSNTDETQWERNTLRISKIARTGIIPISIKNNGSLKYSAMSYDIARQAVVIALCMIYGLSAYNGKKSLVSSNVVQRVHRLLVMDY